MKVTLRLEKAIRIATIAHKEQKRKGSDTPYIIHPYSVMCIAANATQDEDILIACLFHDILEDVPDKYSRERMVEDFGNRVVSIVDGVTKDSTLPDWQSRAEAYLKHLEQEAPDESVIVSCADKTHNLMSMLTDYAEVGDSLWERFKVGANRQLWWYEEILKVIRKRLPELMIAGELEELITRFKKDVNLSEKAQ